MSNLRSTVITGSILDRPVDPRITLDFVTNTHSNSRPIKKKPKPVEKIEQPRELGEKRHLELLDAIKGISVNQNVSQKVTEAISQNRDWRR